VGYSFLDFEDFNGNNSFATRCIDKYISLLLFDKNIFDIGRPKYSEIFFLIIPKVSFLLLSTNIALLLA
jgi:hypothetical protein